MCHNNGVSDEKTQKVSVSIKLLCSNLEARISILGIRTVWLHSVARGNCWVFITVENTWNLCSHLFQSAALCSRISVVI